MKRIILLLSICFCALLFTGCQRIFSPGQYKYQKAKENYEQTKRETQPVIDDFFETWDEYQQSSK